MCITTYYYINTDRPLASTNGIINCNFDSVFYSICLTYTLWIVAVFLAVCVWCENNLLFVSVCMDIHLIYIYKNRSLVYCSPIHIHPKATHDNKGFIDGCCVQYWLLAIEAFHET